jgi:catalase
MTGNNTPIFFIRDPIKFPDFIHTQKRHPQTNLKDADMVWDFFSLSPESLHQATILFSDRGIPDGYRFMHGFSTHALKLVNEAGEAHYAKFHFICDQGIKNLEASRAGQLAGQDPDYATRDLFAAIERKEFPSWTVKMQVIPEGALGKFKYNPFDATKVWPHGEYPVMVIGKMVLNRNPQNYFAEVEQAAFSPSHMVPGIEPTFDRMLQGRLFSYPDTHRHRLGVNYKQIPVNRPIKCPVVHYQRDGAMVVNGNFGALPNYEPNSVEGAAKQTSVPEPSNSIEVAGRLGRFDQRITPVDFVQPARLFQVLGAEGQKTLISNMARAMSGAKPHIRKRQLEVIKRADGGWANRVEQEIYKLKGSRM